MQEPIFIRTIDITGRVIDVKKEFWRADDTVG